MILVVSVQHSPGVEDNPGPRCGPTPEGHVHSSPYWPLEAPGSLLPPAAPGPHGDNPWQRHHGNRDGWHHSGTCSGY